MAPSEVARFPGGGPVGVRGFRLRPHCLTRDQARGQPWFRAKNRERGRFGARCNVARARTTAPRVLYHCSTASCFSFVCFVCFVVNVLFCRS